MQRTAFGAAVAALAWGALALIACGEPSARAVAAWVTAHQGAAVQHVEVYDGGRRYALPWVPDIPGSGTEFLQLGIDDRGRGIALSGIRRSVYHSLRDGRHASLSDADYVQEFFFARSGDALLRFHSGGGPERTLGLLPTSSPFGMVAATVSSPSIDLSASASTWMALSAADAPILYWIEFDESPLRANGVVQAIAYPSDIGAALSVDAPTVLARGWLVGRPIADANHPARAPGGSWCTGRTCISPDGRVLSTMAEDPCTLWRWTWTEVVEPDTPVASTRVSLPEGCPVEDDPFLLAQIGRDLYVLEDDERVYMADLSADVISAVPKLGEDALAVLVRDRGRVVLLVTVSGQVIRVDASGPRLLNTEQTFCSVRDGLVASPSGNWVVQACAQGSLTESFAPATINTIVRTSSLGIERFLGVPMRPLAVDDDGTVLLYSYKATDVRPNGLFVLTGDGQLARVDPLDPKPAMIAVTSTNSGPFATAALE